MFDNDLEAHSRDIQTRRERAEREIQEARERQRLRHNSAGSVTSTSCESTPRGGGGGPSPLTRRYNPPLCVQWVVADLTLTLCSVLCGLECSRLANSLYGPSLFCSQRSLAHDTLY